MIVPGAAEGATYLLPWHNFVDHAHTASGDPYYDPGTNTNGQHALVVEYGTDTVVIRFDTLEDVHAWLDATKAALPKPPPGAGSSVADIDAFLNA